MDRTDRRADAEDRLRSVATIVDRLIERADGGDVFFVRHRDALDHLVAELAAWRTGDAGTKRILALRKVVDAELSRLEQAYKADAQGRAERERRAAADEHTRRLLEARRLEAARRPAPAPVETKDSLGLLYDMRNG
jgi:hypothetical protein